MREFADVYLDQASRESPEHWSGPPGMVDRIARIAGTRRGHTVLDVGGGVGGPGRRLAAMLRCEVVCLDVIHPVLAVAKRRTEADGRCAARVRFVTGDAERLPVADGRIDEVWCLGVVAHLEDTQRFTSEAFRVLRQGGFVVITEGFAEGGRTPRFAAFAPQPWRPVTAGHLVAALLGSGMRNVRLHRWPGGEPEERLRVSDEALWSDLQDGTLVPRLIVAVKP